MAGEHASAALFHGACALGTAEGLTIRGVGCLTQGTTSLLRALDLRTQKLQRNEKAWFVLPYSSGAENGKIIGQIGFASDFKHRDGILGIAVATTDRALARSGYSGSIYLVERLFPWFSQSFDASRGDAAFGEATQVLGQLGIAAAPAAETKPEEPLRLKLPGNWQNYISIQELLRILPAYVEFTEISSRGYVLRTSDTAPFDREIPESFLATWSQELFGPKERLKLEGALQQTYDAYKAEERTTGALKTRVQKSEELAAALDAKLRDADGRLREASARLETANGESRQLADAVRDRDARLQQATAQLGKERQLGAEEARLKYEAERRKLEADKLALTGRAEVQREELNKAKTGITTLGTQLNDLRVELADTKLSLRGYQEREHGRPYDDRTPQAHDGGYNTPGRQPVEMPSIIPKPSLKGGGVLAQAALGGVFLLVAGYAIANYFIAPSPYREPPIAVLQQRDADDRRLAAEAAEQRRLAQIAEQKRTELAVAAAARKRAEADIEEQLRRARLAAGKTDEAEAEAERQRARAAAAEFARKEDERQEAVRKAEDERRRAAEIAAADARRRADDLNRRDAEATAAEAERQRVATADAGRKTDAGGKQALAGAAPFVGSGASAPQTGAGSQQAERCGTDPGYAKRLDEWETCVGKGGKHCTINDYNKFARDLKACPKAASSCPETASIKTTGWFYKDEMAIVRRVLVCVQDAWSRP